MKSVWINEKTNSLIEEIKEKTGITKERLVNDLLIEAGERMLKKYEEDKSNATG